MNMVSTSLCCRISLILLFASADRATCAQQSHPADLAVCVQDTTGAAIANAEVIPRGDPPSLTDATGCAHLAGRSPLDVTVRHAGFNEAHARIAQGDPSRPITLVPADVAEQVSVSDARIPLATDAAASSVLELSGQRLREDPGVTLDDRLRDVAGFQLFRRTSSLVANPTAQGTSLRGLASTAASRTLVLSDAVPLTDGFGGWVHWNEIPELAIADVSLARGGASDLYGSSAIGGVIQVAPVLPEKLGYALDLAGGSEATSSLNGLGTAVLGAWRGLAAVSVVHTDGYILTAPAFRGSVDTAAQVHSESGRLELRRQVGETADAFLRGNLLNEARANGTPDQTNATRLWTYVAGAGWSPTETGRVVLRAYGDRQGYRQSFSSVAANRNSEALTRLQQVPSDQFGGSAQWAATAWHSLTGIIGADLGDTRATDAETPVHAGLQQPTIATSARQRQVGGYGELLWQPQDASPRNGRLLGARDGWSAALSGRVDSFRSFDARQSSPAIAVLPLPEIDETVFDPRLGLVKQVTRTVSLNASVFRAFRGPTMNELYRTGQVGQQTTEANPNLRSERATGFEFGGLAGSGRWGSVRSSYFWTEINRPVSAVTIASTATTLTQMRENLGQLRSRGASAEWVLRPAAWAELAGGYQLAVSTVTRFDTQPLLVGTWTAQVPRNTATAQARLTRARWGTLVLDARTSGRQFDSAGNTFELHSFTAFNVFADRQAWRSVHVYISAQNLFDRSIDAGRTPVLTLAQPRAILAGIRLH